MDDQDKQVLTAKTPESGPEHEPGARPEVQPEPVPSPAPAKKRNRALWVVIGVVALCLALCACAVIGAGAAFGLARVRDGLSLRARLPVEVGPPARVRPPEGVRPPEDVWPPFGCERGECLQSGTGALIVDVTENGPADRAGLQQGDIVVSVDSQALDSEHDLADLIAGHKPGDEVMLQVEEPGGASRTVKVELGEHPDQKGVPYLGVRYMSLPGMMDQGGQFDPFGRRGFHFDRGGPGGQRFEDRLFRFFGDLPFEGGAIIVQVIEDSPAADAGLAMGDVITAVDGQPVDGPAALSETVAGLEPGDEISLTAYRAGDEGSIEIEVTLSEHPDDKGKAYLGVHLGGFTHMERAPGGGEGLPRLQFFGVPGQPQSGQSWEDLLREFEFQWPQEGEDQGPSGLFGDTL